MEDILRDLGLSRFSDKLREKNINLQSFIKILNSKVNAQQLRELVTHDCGLTSGQVLAICDRVQEKIFKDERQYLNSTALSKAVPITPPSNYGKTANSKRISQLLKQPATQQPTQNKNLPISSLQQKIGAKNNDKIMNDQKFHLNQSNSQMSGMLKDQSQNLKNEPKSQPMNYSQAKDPLVKTLFKDQCSQQTAQFREPDNIDISSQASQEYIIQKLEEHRQSQTKDIEMKDEVQASIEIEQMKEEALVPIQEPITQNNIINESHQEELKVENLTVEKVEVLELSQQVNEGIQVDVQEVEQQEPFIPSRCKSETVSQQISPSKSPISQPSNNLSPLNQSPIRSCFAKKEPASYSVQQQQLINQAMQDDVTSEEEEEDEDVHDQQYDNGYHQMNEHHLEMQDHHQYEIQEQQQIYEQEQQQNHHDLESDDMEEQSEEEEDEDEESSESELEHISAPKQQFTSQQLWASGKTVSQNNNTSQGAYQSVFADPNYQNILSPQKNQAQQIQSHHQDVTQMFKNDTDEEDEFDSDMDHEKTVEPARFQGQQQQQQVHEYIPSQEQSFNQLFQESINQHHNQVEEAKGFQKYEHLLSENDVQDQDMEDQTNKVHEVFQEQTHAYHPQQAHVVPKESKDAFTQYEITLMQDNALQTAMNTLKNQEVQVEIIKSTQILIEGHVNEVIIHSPHSQTPMRQTFSNEIIVELKQDVPQAQNEVKPIHKVEHPEYVPEKNNTYQRAEEKQVAQMKSEDHEMTEEKVECIKDVVAEQKQVMQIEQSIHTQEVEKAVVRAEQPTQNQSLKQSIQPSRDLSTESRKSDTVIHKPQPIKRSPSPQIKTQMNITGMTNATPIQLKNEGFQPVVKQPNFQLKQNDEQMIKEKQIRESQIKAKEEDCSILFGEQHTKQNVVKQQQTVIIADEDETILFSGKKDIQKQQKEVKTESVSTLPIKEIVVHQEKAANKMIDEDEELLFTGKKSVKKEVIQAQVPQPVQSFNKDSDKVEVKQHEVPMKQETKLIKQTNGEDEELLFLGKKPIVQQQEKQASPIVQKKANDEDEDLLFAGKIPVASQQIKQVLVEEKIKDEDAEILFIGKKPAAQQQAHQAPIVEEKKMNEDEEMLFENKEVEIKQEVKQEIKVETQQKILHEKEPFTPAKKEVKQWAQQNKPQKEEEKKPQQKQQLAEEEEILPKRNKKRVRFNVIELSEEEQHNSAKKYKKTSQIEYNVAIVEGKRKRQKVNYQEEKVLEQVVVKAPVAQKVTKELDEEHYPSSNDETKANKSKQKMIVKKAQKEEKQKVKVNDKSYSAVSGQLKNIENKSIQNNIMKILFSGK